MNALFRSLIFKIVGLILLIEVFALIGLGVMNSLYFSRGIEKRFVEQIKVPGKLLLLNALRYRSVNDPKIMEPFVGSDLKDVLLVGVDQKIYYSQKPAYRDKTLNEIPNLEFADLLTQGVTETTIQHEKNIYVCVTPLKSESGQSLGYLYIKAGTESIQQEMKGVVWQFVWGSFLAILLTAFIGFVAGSGFSKRINGLISLLKTIAEGGGDLTRRIQVDSSDELAEIAKNYNLFAEKLREIIEKVKFTVDNLATAFKEVSVSSEEISLNSGQQNEQMQHLNATIQDLSVNLKEAARNADQMIKQAQENSLSAGEGKKINEELKSSMFTVRQNEIQFKEELLKLQSNTEEISKVVHLISDMAEQVNILALNASIEAVKAGELGKGFSVVADEVRLLSLQAQNSTQEIAPLIEKIQDQANNAVKVMHSNIEMIEKMTDQVDLSSEKNEKIDLTSTKTLQMAEQTGRIYQQSTSAFGDMGSQIEGASASSREISTAVRQVSDTILQLTSGVDELRQLVEKFVVHANKDERSPVLE